MAEEIASRMRRVFLVVELGRGAQAERCGVAGKASGEVFFRSRGAHLEGRVAIHAAADANQQGAALDGRLVGSQGGSGEAEAKGEESKDRYGRGGAGKCFHGILLLKVRLPAVAGSSAAEG
ncbi:MAG: hypothetical protein DVS81_00855 [Candidatus Accumulibacter meliphilus]|uniref:Uncharacterized protein n=1 Tax=Candidatus Accumulibacter meliphilus TaxID=2211374 RepID=A0A369XVZ9_9PROT|nr:MAG: hypothetical protein DVS81_00855 [Candidatus Accumulibacter meliphilus]